MKMVRRIAYGTMALTMAVVSFAQTTATSTATTSATTTVKLPVAADTSKWEAERAATREQRINAHRGKIEAIISANREKQQQQVKQRQWMQSTEVTTGTR